MLKKFLSIIFFLLLSIPTFSQSEEDIERVNNEAFAAFESYNYRTAIDKEHLILKWMAKKKRLHNDTNELIVYINLGGFYQSYQDYDSAHTCFQIAYDKCVSHFGKKSEFFVHVVLQLGGFYESIEMLPEAEAINQEAIEQIDKGVTEDEWLIGAIYSNQAIVKKKLFKLKDALILLEKSEELTIKTSGRQSTDFANLLNSKALVYGEMGDLKKKEMLLQEAIQICQDLHATSESLYSNLMNNMAGLMRAKGRYNEAIPFYQTAYRLKASIFSEKSLECATVLANQGAVYGDMGRYQDGILMVSRARKIVEDLLGKFHPEWFEYCLHLGTLYENAGNYGEAGKFYQTLIRDAERELGTESLVYLTVLNNAAMYYDNREEYDKSSQYYGLLLKKMDIMPDEYQLSVKGNYANFLNHTGKWEEAGPKYQEVMQGWEEIKGRQSEDYLRASHNYGVYLLDLDQLQEARKILEETKSSLREISGDKSPLMLTLNENLAGIYSDQKDYRMALRMYQDLIETQKDQYGEESIDVADLLSKIGLCYTNLDDPDKGLEYLESAYSMKVKLLGKEDPQLSYELTLIATSYTYRKDFTKGINYYQEATRLIASNFNTYFRFMTEQEKLKFMRSKMSELKQLQAIAVDNIQRYPAFSELAFDVELMMKGMILESGNRLRRSIIQTNDTKLMDQYAQLQDLREQLAVEWLKESKMRRPDFAKLESEAAALEREIVAKVGSTDQLNMELSNWKEIRKKLKKDEAMVEFISYKTFYDEKPSLAALVLSPEMNSPVLVPLFEEAQLQAYLQKKNNGEDHGIVNALYGETRGIVEEDEPPVPTEDDSLYQMIWKPLEKHLNGKQQVYYSPSGSLHKISFAALKDEAGLYLSDKYAMRTLSSSRKILEASGKFKLDKVFLSGGIDYTAGKGDGSGNSPDFVMRGGKSATAWNYLNGTKTEVEQIATVLSSGKGNPELKTGKEATEGKVKQEMLAGPSVIHLSTHGYFFPTPELRNKENLSPYQTADNPLLRSGLILAGANAAWTGQGVPEGNEDGILTAYEVAGMDLSKTHLAVLSACQTGLGDVNGSEGVFGLQRAFKQAGVEYIVMSLWQVPDKETVEFMTLFYQNIAAGQEIEVAFNAAQKVMRGKYAPYYWAAFVLVR